MYRNWTYVVNVSVQACLMWSLAAIQKTKPTSRPCLKTLLAWHIINMMTDTTNSWVKAVINQPGSNLFSFKYTH